MMKKALLSLLLVIGICGYTYAQLDSYKYIIVPKKFQEFKNQNEHGTSTLIKYLFNKQGFNVVYDDQLPPDAIANRCLGLLTHLQDDSSLFATKTTIVLKDCRGEEVFVSAEGRSKQKEYKPAYEEAIRKAFESFSGMSYSYSPKGQDEPVTVSFKDDVKKLDEAKASTDKADEAMVEQVATPQVQQYENKSPKTSEIKKEMQEEKAMETEKIASTTDYWYAQEIPNGFQLVDNTPKIRLKIYKTSVSDIYLAEGDKGNGILYQKAGVWFFEYYDGGAHKIDEIKIKF